MKVNLQAVNFNVDRKLVDFVQEKLDKLEKYYDKIISADVFLRLENTSLQYLIGEDIKSKIDNVFDKQVTFEGSNKKIIDMLFLIKFKHDSSY